MKAMILAAGLGTRLKEYTTHKPKALVEVNGKPLLAWAIENVIRYGFDDIIVNVHHFSEQMIAYLQTHTFDARITISDESNELLDTGGGLLKAQNFFDDGKPFLVYNVDVFSKIDLSNMLDFHLKNNALATLAVSKRKTSRYFEFSANNELVGWKNITTGEEIKSKNTLYPINLLAFSGIQIISPNIFSQINLKGKFSLTALYLELAKQHTILGYEHNPDLWMDLGKPEQLEIAKAF